MYILNTCIESMGILYKKSLELFKAFLWCGPGLNRRHMDFQSIALPTELSHLPPAFSGMNPFRGCKNKGILFN